MHAAGWVLSGCSSTQPLWGPARSATKRSSTNWLMSLMISFISHLLQCCLLGELLGSVSSDRIHQHFPSALVWHVNELWTQESSCNPSTSGSGKQMIYTLVWNTHRPYTFIFINQVKKLSQKESWNLRKDARSDNCTSFVIWDNIFNLFEP